jgi:hypothetical protein
MKIKVVAIVLAAACSVGFAQVGAKKPHDNRVKQVLEEAELKYEIDKDGDFKTGNKFDNGRTQLAWVLSNTNKLGNLEIREIWSIGYASESRIPDRILRKLLEQNRKVKLGAWQIRKMGDQEVAVFSAQVAADADKETLLLALQAVTSTADEMEKELTGKDAL